MYFVPAVFAAQLLSGPSQQEVPHEMGHFQDVLYQLPPMLTDPSTHWLDSGDERAGQLAPWALIWQTAGGDGGLGGGCGDGGGEGGDGGEYGVVSV